MTEAKSTEIHDHAGDRLSNLVTAASLDALQVKQNKQLIDYLTLIIRWNARTNLTAVRDEEGILSRHFVESIACAQALPDGITTLLDFGSGAGFPGIPIAICRPEIAVTLAESQGKKAAFLQEAIRVLECSTWNNPIKVHAGRAETLTTQYDCVTLRAVDRMEQAVEAAAQLVKPNGWLAPMTTTADLAKIQSATSALQTRSFAAHPYIYVWSDPIPLPGADHRVLALARRCA
jgi:16S rRNA (guanine527-N7)-methyltransferase